MTAAEGSWIDSQQGQEGVLFQSDSYRPSNPPSLCSEDTGDVFLG